MINIKKLETELWEAADLLRAGSEITSNEYCMPVLGLIFLRYAFTRYKRVEAEILKDRPSRGGRTMPIEASDFKEKSALFLPQEAQYNYLLNLPTDVALQGLVGNDGTELKTLGEVINNAMVLIEQQSEQLKGVLPKNYNRFDNNLLVELLRIFNNSALNEVGGDIIGRIYEYFLNKFAKNVAQDDGVFFTPKSLVKMIVNVLEPKQGILLDPACGSGGMFVQTGDFVNSEGMVANQAMTFYGQEKVDYNAKLCLMNMAVHGLTGVVKSGDAANTFYHDAHSLNGCCDYVMANPPFNVSKVKAEGAQSAGRLPFGLPGYNAKSKEIGNANYLWISYFYSYLNERGRAGFVMASSATDSQNKDKDIRELLVRTGHVDCLVSVGNNFFYTLSLPCTLWFFDKAKSEAIQDSVLMIDSRNYYTVVDRTLNEWSEWQQKNLNAIVWLYRGETQHYKQLIKEYWNAICEFAETHDNAAFHPAEEPTFASLRCVVNSLLSAYKYSLKPFQEALKKAKKRDEKNDLKQQIVEIEDTIAETEAMLTTMDEAIWLTDKFGYNGKYQDIPGLCKMVSISEIEEKEWSLTPGAYVGVAEVEDDGVDFKSRMKEIHNELLILQEESNELMAHISKNMEEMEL